jgi:hypothetical protein
MHEWDARRSSGRERGKSNLLRLMPGPMSFLRFWMADSMPTPSKGAWRWRSKGSKNILDFIRQWCRQDRLCHGDNWR